jgi:ATP-dependent Clp protease ATP-binding subunit ClpC
MAQKEYTDELKSVVALMFNELIQDNPSNQLNIQYFILAILKNKNCTAYKLFSEILLSDHIDSLRLLYFEYLQKNSLSVINPNKKIKFDKVLDDIFEKSEIECNKLKDNLIGSEHVLLSLLHDKNEISKKFNTLGLTYDMFLSKIKSFKNFEISDEDLLNSINKIDDSINNNNLSIVANKKNDEVYFEKLPANITKYCINYNAMSANAKFDTLIGRQNEILKLMKILTRRNKNNAILVGLGGSGKTAIVQGLTQMIQKKTINNNLRNKIVLSLDYTSLSAGTSYKGMFEERVKLLFDELKNSKKYILFIDDIHLLLNDKNGNDINVFLNNLLTNSNIQVITTTTYKDYKKIITPNANLTRNFQKINIEPTSIAETIEILNNNKLYYEKFHNIKFDDKALNLVPILAEKYITERQLPDSAIDIIDQAGSSKNINRKPSIALDSLQIELNNILLKKTKAMQMEDYKTIDECTVEQNKLNLQIKYIEQSDNKIYNDNIEIISENDIYNVISDMTNIPVNKLDINERYKILHLEENLKNNVIGQDTAIKHIVKSIYRARTIKSQDRPMSFIFLGASGIGKTLIAKQLAKELFGSEDKLIRIDMSEYSDKTSVSKILGSSPGYVGWSEPTVFQPVKDMPYCVILCDEIEKAHKDVFNTFLQILDDGILTDSAGDRIHFANAIFILTSNLGSRAIQENLYGIGFSSNFSTNSQEETNEKIIRNQLKKFFAPEFLNRIDDIIIFNNLKSDDIKKIIKLELNILNNRLNELNYNIEFSDKIIDYILNEINLEPDNNKFGARPIRRKIQDKIENIIAEDILHEKILKNIHYIISIDEYKNIIIL